MPLRGRACLPLWSGLRGQLGAFGIYLRHDLRDLAPGGTFRIRIEHAHVGDGMLMVVGGRLGNGGCEIGDIRVKGHERSRVTPSLNV